MDTNEQMSFEDFMTEVKKQIEMANTGEATKMRLRKEPLEYWQMYFEDNLTPQEAVQAMMMGA